MKRQVEGKGSQTLLTKEKLGLLFWAQPLRVDLALGELLVYPKRQ